MSKNNSKFLYFIGTIQFLDITTHAISNQLEVIRVSSSLLLLIWILILILGKARIKSSLSWIFIGIYIITNIVFLLLNGVSNPQSNGIRFPLFIFVGATTLMSVFYMHRSKGINKILSN